MLVALRRNSFILRSHSESIVHRITPASIPIGSPTNTAAMSTSTNGNDQSSTFSANQSDTGGHSFPPTREGYLRVREGSVFMDYDEKEAVFYNKVQEFNRDMSVQVIRLFAEQREAEKAAKFAKRQKAWEVRTSYS